LGGLVRVARGEDESGGLAKHGSVCYHFPVKRSFAGALLLALALCSCTRTVQEEDLSDPAVKANIELQLKGRPELDLRYVTVDVHSGIATVSGLVPDLEQQRLIDRLVRRTRGVDHILNNLVIQE
ncbi:MAG TPA: hypothetical protein DCZ01_06425, partial [Elusimicrobia bacterium]|nr:hypothetical protein [Elusimicrobiota bacterium]